MSDHPLLRMMMAKYEGHSCSICEHKYTSVDDLLERDVVATSDGAATIGCKACFEAQHAK